MFPFYQPFGLLFLKCEHEAFNLLGVQRLFMNTLMHVMHAQVRHAAELLKVKLEVELEESA